MSPTATSSVPDVVAGAASAHAPSVGAASTAAGAASSSAAEENVKVTVRVRPLNEDETAENYRSIVRVDAIHGSVTIENPNQTRENPPKVFTFDSVFPPDVKQLDVYNRVARPIVENVLAGYNGTIFAYGQTGTGKTYTMEGVRTVAELKGIIPNSFAHIFGHIAKAEDNVNFLVRVSYLEIYNEEVRDLLCKDQNTRLDVKERPDVGVYVKDLSAFVVNNADDMDKIMTLGNNYRSVGATNMNAHSSRSHAIFTITIECSEKGLDGQQHLRAGKLHLVDLAGSERQSKTGATGQRLKEATKINLSLSTLGNVISALVDGKSSHVPYRNSNLTRLLQDSLGGNSKTVMFANVGPAEYNYDESLSTLRYASRAKNIKNHAKVNEDPKDALMKQYQKEIEELKRLLADEEEVCDDDGGGGGGRRADGRRKGDDGGGRRADGRRSSEHNMEELKQRIEAERKQLNGEKSMAEEERNKVKKELQKHEEELAQAKKEHELLQSKLNTLEKKIIVGGVNLLEKAEEQERLLEESAREMEKTIENEKMLRLKLEEKEAERLDIEEKYSSLQEEAAGKTRKLKKVYTMYQGAKAELGDLQAEQQREMEGLLDNVRQLTRELRLQMLIIDQFVPREYQTLIEQNVAWNEEIDEWQLKCVAYTGNNMRKRTPSVEGQGGGGGGGGGGERGGSGCARETDLTYVYLQYPEEVVRPRTARSKTSGVSGTGVGGSSRPKSSRPKSRSIAGFACLGTDCFMSSSVFLDLLILL